MLGVPGFACLDILNYYTDMVGLVEMVGHASSPCLFGCGASSGASRAANCFQTRHQHPIVLFSMRARRLYEYASGRTHDWSQCGRHKGQTCTMYAFSAT